jgi:transposase
MLIPNVAKTWAPVGQTPVLRHACKREKISVISGVSVSPKRKRLGLYYLLFYDNIGQEEVCLFLRHLLRHLRGPVIALLDNCSTHGGKLIQELRRQHPRLLIEYFPSYAPDVNPDESVWCQSKQKLANNCANDIEELTQDIIRSINGIRNSQSKLRSCIEASELPSFLR